MIQQGKVYLVGAGPGDPDLITLKAAQLLTEADVVVYDALSNDSLLGLCKATAEKVFVGKRIGRHSYAQEEINQILVVQAQKGRSVVRLKGGDPFVFGRGGEEMLALHREGLPYEVVPGVTAGIAVPAYAGIPVSHRGVSTSIIFITATTKEHQTPDIDWDALARMGGTIVFYMGTQVAPLISQKLIEAGLKRDTPMCIISDGTLPTQRIIKASVADFTLDYTDYESLSPGLVVIGEVVAFAEQYAWRLSKPLTGKNILVTRSLAQSSRLAEQLIQEGASVTTLPTIEIIPCKDLSELSEEIQHITNYRWIVFTSTNGVEIFFTKLRTMGLDLRKLHQLKFGAVGKATAAALRKEGILADFVPLRHSGVDFAEEFISKQPVLRGLRILIAGSTLSSGALPQLLGQAGAMCRFVAIYDNRPITYSKEQIDSLTTRPIDYITFCSSSAVENFYHMVEQYRLQDWVKGIRKVSIGPMTSASVAKYDQGNLLQASQASIPALVQAIITDNN